MTGPCRRNIGPHRTGPMLHRYDDGPARGWPGRVAGGVTGTGGRSGAEGKRSGGKVSEQPSLAVGPGITGPALQRCLATTLRCAPEQIGTPRFASVSSRQKPLCRAECNKAPSMYEMEGALSSLAARKRPVARPPQRCAPPARARHPCDKPVARFILTSPKLPSGGVRF
jgi:hypothetical protein